MRVVNYDFEKKKLEVTTMMKKKDLKIAQATRERGPRGSFQRPIEIQWQLFLKPQLKD